MADKKTKDEAPKLPYLAIRNWAKFQTTTDKNGKSLEGRARPYIRDYCDKETDTQYAALSITARYLFDACRRLKGKTGRNLPNDHMWILRQLDVDPTERGRCTHALQSLITRGLLIPTTQQLDIPQPATPSLPSPLEVPIELNATVNGGEESDDSRGEQEEDQDPTLGETPNPHGDTLTALLDSPPAWLDKLLRESVEVRRKVICVADWVDTKSTVWKGKPCLGLGGYRAMEKSYDNFFARVPEGKKPHQLKNDEGQVPVKEKEAEEVEVEGLSDWIDQIEEDEPTPPVKPTTTIVIPSAAPASRHPEYDEAVRNRYYIPAPTPADRGHHFYKGKCHHCYVHKNVWERNGKEPCTENPETQTKSAAFGMED